MNRTDLLRTNYTTKDDLKCGGFLIEGNEFTKNVGCKNTMGVMHIYCFDAALQTNLT